MALSFRNFHLEAAGASEDPCGQVDIQTVLGLARSELRRGQPAKLRACLFHRLSAVHVMSTEYQHVARLFHPGQNYGQVSDPSRMFTEASASIAGVGNHHDIGGIIRKMGH